MFCGPTVACRRCFVAARNGAVFLKLFFHSLVKLCGTVTIRAASWATLIPRLASTWLDIARYCNCLVACDDFGVCVFVSDTCFFSSSCVS